MDDLDGLLEAEEEQQRELEEQEHAYYLALQGKETKQALQGKDEFEKLLEEEQEVMKHAREESGETRILSSPGIMTRTVTKRDTQVTVGGKCEKCHSLMVDNMFFTEFKVHVCFDCKKSHGEYKMISKSRVKDDYLLSDRDISELPWVTMANPRKPGWGNMKLYLTRQVEEVARQKWGSLEHIEDEQTRRIRSRLAKRRKNDRGNNEEEGNMFKSGIENEIAKLRKELGAFQAETKAQTKANSVSGEPVETSQGKRKKHRREEKRKKSKRKKLDRSYQIISDRYHKHNFGDEEHVGGEEWKKTCKDCGFEMKFEKL